MNRFSVFVLILGIFTIGGFIGCAGDDDNGPVGPTLTVPHDLVAVPLSSSSISLEWIDEDANGLGYRVERGSGADWTEIGEVNFDVTTFTDEDLDEGTTYQYRVKSFGRDGDSAPSVTATATTLPFSPSSLNAMRLSGSSISLSWTNRSEMDSGIDIQRSLQAGTGYELIAEGLADTVESFTDTELEIRTTYYYRVRAILGDQTSLWSNVSNAVTSVFTPYPPTNLELDVRGDTQIQLSWSPQIPSPDGIVIEMSLNGNDSWSADSISGNARSYIANDLLSATMYFFRGFAYNDSGSSEYSDIVSGETEPGPPLAPSELGGTAPDYSQVILNWTDNSNDEAGFYVQRKKAEFLDWTDDAVELAVDANTWVDDDVRHTTTYDFRVRAFNEYGTSDWASSIRIIVPAGPPNAPINLIATGAGIDKIRLAWQAGSINDTGYLIERKGPGEERFELFNEVRGSQIFLDEGLEPETEYSYRVIAFKEVGDDLLESDPSDPASGSTLSLTVIDDNFEDYDLNEPPDHPAYEITQDGNSTLRVTADSNHEGDQGLKFIDRIANDGDFSRVVINTRPMQKGTISMWVNIAPEGFFGFIGGDANNLITFQLQLQDDNTFGYRNGGSFVVGDQGFPTNEWAFLEFKFDFETHSYNIFFDGSKITPDPSVQNNEQVANVVFIMLGFSNTTIDYVLIDELLFEEEVGGEALLKVPSVPLFAPGVRKITDTNIYNIERKQ